MNCSWLHTNMQLLLQGTTTVQLHLQASLLHVLGLL